VLLPSLRAVVLTHFHPDHCLDLFALIFGLRHPELRHCRLTVAGPIGTAALLERGRAAFGKWATLAPERLEVLELAPGPFVVELERQRLEGAALPMPHLDHSLGYRIRGHARTLAYSGDTGTGTGGPLADAPVALGRGADVYVLEAAQAEGGPTDFHLTPSAAARIAAAAGVRELVLTHFPPDGERSDVRPVVREHFLGALVMGYDGLRLPL
jgi:ribonuclease BN (tRNA processing enzyme)